MRVNDGRDRIGRIMKSVDELEAERNQQGNEQQQERNVGHYLRPTFLDVDIEAVRHEQQCDADDTKEKDARERIDGMIELGAAVLFGRFWNGSRKRSSNISHGNPRGRQANKRPACNNHMTVSQCELVSTC